MLIDEKYCFLSIRGGPLAEDRLVMRWLYRSCAFELSEKSARTSTHDASRVAGLMASTVGGNSTREGRILVEQGWIQFDLFTQ